MATLAQKVVVFHASPKKSSKTPQSSSCHRQAIKHMVQAQTSLPMKLSVKELKKAWTVDVEEGVISDVTWR